MGKILNIKIKTVNTTIERQKVTYVYNTEKQVICIKDGDTNKWFTYHPNNKPSSYRFKDNKRWYLKKYDLNGNEIYHKDSSGFIYEKTYDANGNCLSYKTNRGYNETFIYNDLNQLVYWNNSKGDEEINTYSPNGKLIACVKKYARR